METVPITIRIPVEYIEIIDAIAKEESLSRAEVLRQSIEETIKANRRKQRQQRLVAAARRARAFAKEVDDDLNGTIADGLEDKPWD